MKARTLVVVPLLLVDLISTTGGSAKLPADPGWPRRIKQDGKKQTSSKPQSNPRRSIVVCIYFCCEQGIWYRVNGPPGPERGAEATDTLQFPFRSQ